MVNNPGYPLPTTHCNTMSSETRPTAAPIPPPRRRYRILFSAARGLALLLGAFTLLNVVGELRHPGFDANLWWIDLRLANRTVNRLLMTATGIGLLSFAIRPQWAPCRGWLLSGLLGLLITVATTNAWTFHQLVAAGNVHSKAGVPLSSLVVIVLGMIIWAVRFRGRIASPRLLDRACFVASIAFAAVSFPLAQMLCFGLTDYRRPADVIVVFGCYVRADGVPSMALSDRVRMGVELYRSGLAPRLVFSGGPGDGAVHEVEAMRQLALELDVPDSAIELDRDGLNTQATVRNLVAGSDGNDPPRVLAVSNFYHLPRIKLCFRRAGWEVWTVPAVDSRRLYYQERFMLREVAALWWYYLNPN